MESNFWKLGSKAQKQENRTQGVYSNKTSRLCFQSRASNPVTRSAIFFLLSSPTVSSVTAVEPPLPEWIT